MLSVVYDWSLPKTTQKTIAMTRLAAQQFAVKHKNMILYLPAELGFALRTWLEKSKASYLFPSSIILVHRPPPRFESEQDEQPNAITSAHLPPRSGAYAGGHSTGGARGDDEGAQMAKVRAHDPGELCLEGRSLWRYR